MVFTQEEKVELLAAYRPLLRKLVRRAIVFFHKNTPQDYDDLYQTAMEGFLRHLAKVESRYEVGGCWLTLYNLIVHEIRRMHFVSFSRREFLNKRHETAQLPLECAAFVPAAASEDAWVSDMMARAFLDSLAPEERKAVWMRAGHECTNKEIMPVIGVSNEMGVSRFFKRMARRWDKHNRGESGHDNGGVRG